MLRLGDATYNAVTAAAGIAMPVYIDEYSVTATQSLLQSQGLPIAYNPSQGGLPCTLATGQIGTQLFDADGMPSNTQDGTLVSRDDAQGSDPDTGV